MFWSSLLLMASFYTWYLIFLPQGHPYPASLTGFPGLLLVGLLPAALAFAFNSRFLARKPSVFQLILANLAGTLLMAALTAWHSGFFREFPLQPGTAPPLALLFPSFWQLFSWSCGAYYLITPLTSGERPSQPLWGSLLLTLPAVFLLAFMDRPLITLMAVLLCWFFLLALSLALEGDAQAPGETRHDLVIFHALVPVGLAFTLYATAFFRDLRELLFTARKLILAFLAFLLRLLDALFGKLPEGEPFENGYTPTIPGEEMAERASELPPWVILLFAVPLALFLLYTLVPMLLNWLGSRLDLSLPKARRRPFSLSKTLKRLLRWWAMFFKGLFRAGAGLALCCKRLSLLIYLRLCRAWRQMLPPRTPYEKVLRTYKKFLRWGRSLGCRRLPGETPLEYARRLEGLTPPAGLPRQEINRLTELFLIARYSGSPVSPRHGEECEGLLKAIQGH